MHKVLFVVSEAHPLAKTGGLGDVNHWQTASVTTRLLLRIRRPATVFTILNLAYQGLFATEIFPLLRLPPPLWSADGLEYYGQLSFIKGGLAYADRLTTVSPT